MSGSYLVLVHQTKIYTNHGIMKESNLLQQRHGGRRYSPKEPAQLRGGFLLLVVENSVENFYKR